jgi:hypothetical protein
MLSKFDDGVVDFLERTHNSSKKLDRHWLEDQIGYYKEKLKTA